MASIVAVSGAVFKFVQRDFQSRIYVLRKFYDLNWCDSLLAHLSHCMARAARYLRAVEAQVPLGAFFVEEWITQFLTAHGAIILYLGTFGLLVVCGLGVPLPEEATFLCAGFAAKTLNFTDTEMLLLGAVGVAGILVGDSFPFLMGKRYGLALLKRPRFAKVVTPKRIESVQKHFHTWGNWTVFGARFVAGLRMPTFFLAATMGVKYTTFLFLDMLGALISCPTSIWLAWRFGQQAKEFVAQSHVYIFTVLGLAVAYMIYHYVSHKEKPEESAEMKSEVLPESPPTLPPTPTPSETKPEPAAKAVQK